MHGGTKPCRKAGDQRDLIRNKKTNATTLHRPRWFLYQYPYPWVCVKHYGRRACLLEHTRLELFKISLAMVNHKDRRQGSAMSLSTSLIMWIPRWRRSSGTRSSTIHSESVSSTTQRRLGSESVLSAALGSDSESDPSKRRSHPQLA
jgi:hypothetical protein